MTINSIINQILHLNKIISLRGIKWVEANTIKEV